MGSHGLGLKCMGCSGRDSECRGCSEVHSDRTWLRHHGLHSAAKRKRDFFLFEKFQSSECAGSFGAGRHAHRVPPIGDKVLPTTAWGHLQVGPGIPALISCGSWDSRHPDQGRPTFAAVSQGWIGRRVAGVGLSNVCSASGLGVLPGSEMIRGADVAGCIFVCRFKRCDHACADEKLTWTTPLAEQWVWWAALPPAQWPRWPTPASSLTTVTCMKGELSATAIKVHRSNRNTLIW